MGEQDASSLRFVRMASARCADVLSQAQEEFGARLNDNYIAGMGRSVIA